MLPEDFTIQLATTFMNYLLRDKHLQRNYVNREISFLKGVLKFAVQKEIIKINPISDIELRHEKPKPIVALSQDELNLLMKHRFASLRLQQVADLYIFQSFTGFAYCDVMDFDYKKHTKVVNSKTWIFKTRVKCDAEAIIPLFDEAVAILDKYAFSLPVITNQKYNAYMKEISEILGIEKKLTTHTARKTFATLKLNDGFSIESVAKMLGHNSIKITQSTYAQVGVLRIENDMLHLKTR